MPKSKLPFESEFLPEEFRLTVLLKKTKVYLFWFAAKNLKFVQKSQIDITFSDFSKGKQH